MTSPQKQCSDPMCLWSLGISSVLLPCCLLSQVTSARDMTKEGSPPSLGNACSPPRHGSKMEQFEFMWGFYWFVCLFDLFFPSLHKEGTLRNWLSLSWCTLLQSFRSPFSLPRPSITFQKMKNGTMSHSSTLEIRETLSFLFSPSGRSPLWLFQTGAHFLLSAVGHSKQSGRLCRHQGIRAHCPKPQAGVGRWKRAASAPGESFSFCNLSL